MVGMIAHSWAKDQKDRRGRSSAIKLPLRLRLMKAHVDPILSTFCRSRSWTSAQLRALKRAQAYALRRAFGVDRFSMQEEHISDRMMFQAAEWDPGSRHCTQGTWFKSLLAKTSISFRDLFRISVSREGQWQAAGRRFFLRSDSLRNRPPGSGLGRKVPLFQCLPPREFGVLILFHLVLLVRRFVRFVARI